VVIHRLHRRMTHLLALSPTCRRFYFSVLTIVLPETDVHVALDIDDVLQNIIDHTLLDGPAEEIQLAYCGLLYRCLATDLEADALSAAERVEEPLRIGLEFTLVVEMYHELAIFMCVGHVELLGIVRHEPIDQAEAYG